MQESAVHSFHIPVLGLAFSIDTPLRVGRFGISSVVSIVDDILIEHMRKHYASVYGEEYTPISPKDTQATTYHLLGYDESTTIPDQQGRPHHIAAGGRVRDELLG